MTLSITNLEVHQTWLGELILRRRDDTASSWGTCFEVLLDDRLLMSSLVNQSEIALAELGLAAVDGAELDVVVGGLGLGCTAAAALALPRVRSMLVVECLSEVIAWHQLGLVPLGPQLLADARCRLVEGDFFALVGPAGAGFDPLQPERRFHAILMDIDHSPRGLLHGSHREFYEPQGLCQVVRHLHPGGVFALWSADQPEPEFIDALSECFAEHHVHEIAYHNPVLRCDDLNTIYVARTAVPA